MAGLVVDIVRGTTKAGAAIFGSVGAADENEKHRQRVEVKYKELECLAEDLRNSMVSILPLSCQQSLQRFKESLCTCGETCEKMRNRSALGNMYHAQKHRRDLEMLERLLSEALDSLQQVCFRALLAQNEELRRHVDERETRLKVETIHPGAGIYKGASMRGCKEKVLKAPDKPEVIVDGTLLVITWRDSQNSSSEGIIRYEVRYEDEKELIASGTPKELKIGKKKEGMHAMTLGPPKVVPGKQNVYTIQVRAVSRLWGPGEWSEAIVTRLVVGPPDKPKKPIITALSPREVLLHVQRPEVDEENGRPVSECIVEFVSKNADVISQWQSLRYPIESDIGEGSTDMLKYSVRGLEPGSEYRFRVKMVNEAGISKPSKAEDVCMEHLIPGPPQNLHVSTKRTDKMIKIRWKPPAIHPQSVDKYIVQMQLKGERQAQNEWDVVKDDICSEKLSATIRDLKGKTKYRFRVAAVNLKGDLGNFSKIIVAETRCGVGRRMAVAAGAFVVGTVGAPLLGAIGIGRYAGSVVCDRVGSDAIKMAACTVAGVGGIVTGTVLGTVGAPFFGVAAAALGYESAAGKMTDWSPQSSDDEREPSMIREIWKASLPH